MNPPADKVQFSIKIEQEKAALRREMLARLKSLQNETRERHSARIRATLLASSLWQDSRTILLFHPLRSEPDLAPLLDCAVHRIVLPRVTPDGLELHHFAAAGGSLRRSQHGMLEPDPQSCPRAGIEEIDLAIVPGLAFDPSSGVRLGRGGGYYDRLLAEPSFRAITIGVAFEFQMHPGLHRQPHDQAVSALLSESGLKK